MPNARGMAMAAWLVPLNPDGPQMGVGAEWPPTRPIWSSQWAAREPAVTIIIQPGQVLQLAFGVLRTTAADGYWDGPMVVYTAGHSRYALHERVRPGGRAHELHCLPVTVSGLAEPGRGSRHG